MKERVQAQGCAPSFRSDYPSLSTSLLAVNGYTSCLKAYGEECNFIRDTAELENQVQRVLAREKYGPIRRMRYSLSSVINDGCEGISFLVSKSDAVFRINNETNGGKTEYVFPQFL